MIQSSPFSPLATQSLQMVEVEGGSFMMGSGRRERERPIHEVELSSFFLSQYAVSQALWTEVMGENPSKFKGSELPVESISWNDCQDFLKKLNERLGLEVPFTYRLPTEAEWEYAARGGKYANQAEYAGSGVLKEVGWFGHFLSDEKNTHGHTEAQGLRILNELGLYDMSGNVREWCWDWYGSYSSGSLKDPQGPEAGSGRVLRGGSWIRHADVLPRGPSRLPPTRSPQQLRRPSSRQDGSLRAERMGAFLNAWSPITFWVLSFLPFAERCFFSIRETLGSSGRLNPSK